MKDGQTLDPKDVGIRNSNTDTILFIRKAELHHSGAYEVTLQIENMTDKVAITMQIIGKNLTTSKLSMSYKTKQWSYSGNPKIQLPQNPSSDNG